MKIFFDSEFTGLHQKTTLISIGLVTEDLKDRDGSIYQNTFYAEFTDYDKNQIDDWLTENVLNNLILKRKIPNSISADNFTIKSDKITIRNYLSEWLNSFKTNIEIWSDCLAYDWILFCELFGGAMNIPECVSYIPMDICTLMKIKDIDPDINREDFVFNNDKHKYGQIFDVHINKHNSLYDAKVIKECYKKLIDMVG